MNQRIHRNALNVADLILDRRELEKAISQNDVINLSDDQLKELVSVLENRKTTQFDFSDYEAIAVSGTGGSRINTINVSTLAALLTASLLSECSSTSAIVKTGTQSSQPSRKGTYDIMKMLNFKIGATKESVAYDIKHYGISFIASTHVYPWLGYLDLIEQLAGKKARDLILFDMDRDETGISNRFIGVVNPDLNTFANNYDINIYKSLCFVHGRCGDDAQPYDEMSICGSSDVFFAAQRHDTLYLKNLTPRDFGLEQYLLQDIVIDDANDAYKAITLLLDEKKPLPPAWEDLIILNASVLLSHWEKRFDEFPAKATCLKGHFREKFPEYLRRIHSDKKRSSTETS